MSPIERTWTAAFAIFAIGLAPTVNARAGAFIPDLDAPIYAVTYTVDTTIDAPDKDPNDGRCLAEVRLKRPGFPLSLYLGMRCTLRAAIQEANLRGNAVSWIVLPLGTYALSHNNVVSGGEYEEYAATGDLDVRSNVTIVGDGENWTVIDGAATPQVATDRVLDIHSGTVKLVGLTIRNGAIQVSDPRRHGGGIYNAANLSIERSRITGNRSLRYPDGVFTAFGGGIYNEGTLTLNDTRVDGNKAWYGGGIANDTPGTAFSPLVLVDSTVSDNRAESAGSGGGLYVNRGPVSITRSTLSNNLAKNSGGAIYGGDFNDAQIQIENSTISGNMACEGEGGALYLTAEAVIESSTIANNASAVSYEIVANAQGGTTKPMCGPIGSRPTRSSIYLSETGDVTFGLTILDVSNPTSQKSCDGEFADFIADVHSLGWNVERDASCLVDAVIQAGDLRNRDPRLDAKLQFNAGSSALPQKTKTHALAMGSPAIDRAPLTMGPATDQRRERRWYSNGSNPVDSGAFEFIGTTPAN